MKKSVLILLAALLLVTFAACDSDENKGNTPADPPSYSKPEGEEKPQGNKTKLTWDKINAFPVKRADMTEAEMRQYVVDFYKFSKTFIWTADADYTYQLDEGYAPITLNEDGVYAGFPYVSKGTSNVYRIMDFLDPDTGILNITDAGENPRIFGNQCSMSCQWAWARVINSVKGGWTNQITKANGYLPLGSYSYPADLEQFDKKYSIDSIILQSGRDVMYEAYTQLKAGDGLVKEGHVILCTGDAHVEHTADGKIDPALSYILMSDQTRNTGWKTYLDENKNTYKMCGNIDKKYSFFDLFDEGYLPFSFKEYTGEDPIEETVVSFSHTGDTITQKQIMGARVTANYYISDIYAVVTDSKGNEVYRFAVRATAPATLRMTFTKNNKTSDGAPAYTVWGSWDNVSSKEEYTVKIIAQLGTGERPTVWEGKLAQ